VSVKAVARNYAQALLTLAEEAKGVEPWAELIDAVAEGVKLAPEAEAVLMSPKITKAAKAQLIASALPKAPKPFVGFLQAVVKRGRQGLLREIADEYPGERMYVGEIVIENQEKIATYVERDQLHLSFNFAFLFEPWDAGSMRRTIERTLDALGAVGRVRHGGIVGYRPSGRQ
jgi:hypothetical protein